MIIYVFGNQDLSEDSIAIKVIPHLKKSFPQIIFQEIKPNEDLPFSNSNENSVIIMDVVAGINKIILLDENSSGKLISPLKSTVHDYDLGFQLKYLMKLGKLKKVTIIGLPMNKKIDQILLHSILRKLVAQDIQGS